MNVKSIRDEFKDRVCEQVEVHPEGEGRYVVFTPFRFDDGDHFGIFLKRRGRDWVLSDEASTLMHLSYRLDEDVQQGNRGDIIENCLAGFSVHHEQGELFIPVRENRFGDALFSFIQALTKVSDVSYLSRERVRSTFLEDFRAFLRSTVEQRRLTFDWTDEAHDSAQRYPVDARINGIRRPLFVYAVPNDEKVNLAMISLLMFEKWSIPFHSLAIFEDQKSISRSALARFTDVNEKAFSSLEDNKNRIASYIHQLLKMEA